MFDAGARQTAAGAGCAPHFELTPICVNTQDPFSILWAFRAESAHEIDDKAYRQNQANPAAADDGTAKVKPAAAEQEKQNNQE
jgi:hypothetical protein